MKKFLIKSVIIIALFALSYGVVMIVAYDYLYPYPKGFLEIWKELMKLDIML